MANHQRRAHADKHLLAMEALVNDFLGFLGYWHQAIDKQFCDAWYQFHHRSHRNAQEKYLFYLHLGHQTDERTNDNSKHQRFPEHSKFPFKALRVNIQFVKTGYFFQHPVHAERERNKTLAEWLRPMPT